MGTNCGAIDAVVTTIRHDLGQGDRNDLPYPGFAPTSEPSIDHIPVTIFWRNIAPWRAAAKTPKYAIDDGTVLFGSTTTPSVRSINRKQGLQNAPLCFAQIASAQACLRKPALNQAGSFASTNLATPPRVRTHYVHQIMIATSVIAAMQMSALLSYRVWARLQSLSLAERLAAMAGNMCMSGLTTIRASHSARSMPMKKRSVLLSTSGPQSPGTSGSV